MKKYHNKQNPASHTITEFRFDREHTRDTLPRDSHSKGLGLKLIFLYVTLRALYRQHPEKGFLTGANYWVFVVLPLILSDFFSGNVFVEAKFRARG